MENEARVTKARGHGPFGEEEQGRLPDRNEDEPIEQTAIEPASVIHLLRVFVAGTGPAPVDAMQHDAPPGDGDQREMSREEAGCLLWDMSASRPVARVMCQHRALDVLELVLARDLLLAQAADNFDPSPARGRSAGPGDASPPATEPSRQLSAPAVQNSLRILEICLGILANLVITHPEAASSASSRPDLLALLLAPPRGPDAASGGRAARGGGGSDDGSDTVGSGGGVLYLDDARVLSELFRLCSLALRGQGAREWLAVLRSPAALRRVMWVAAATADQTVFARCLDMLVALLHAASASPASHATRIEAAGPPREPEEAAAAAAEAEAEAQAAGQPAAAATGAVAAAAAANARRLESEVPVAVAVGRCLLRCGLLELIHGVLSQALRGCLPVDDKGTDLEGDGGGAEAGGGSNSGGSRGGSVEPPGAAGCGSAPVETVAGSTPTGLLAEASARCGGGGDGSGRAEQLGGDDEDVVAAAAAAGAVPLSDEALDAALRLIEELVTAAGPLSSCHATATDADGGDGSGGPAAELVRMYDARGLRPGLMRLLLGLLRHHTDSAQVFEGLVVVLVDLGAAAVQAAVAAVPPADAAAVASRLAEALHDTGYGGAGGGNGGGDATSAATADADAAQLQQGAWYLLAAALRGVLSSAAAAAVAGGGGGEAGGERRGGAGAGAAVPHAEAVAARWLGQWPALSRTLAALPGLPRPSGCAGYARACAAAGRRIVELLPAELMTASAAAAASRKGGAEGAGAAADVGGGRGGRRGGGGGGGGGGGAGGVWDWDAPAGGEAEAVPAEEVRVALTEWLASVGG